MKKAAVCSMLLAVGAMTPVFAHDYQVASNAIGDWRLVTLGGYTLAKPISIDLTPQGAPESNGVYSVRCQVVYKDAEIARPQSADEFARMLATGTQLNEWLQAFVLAQYGTADFDDLTEKYGAGRLAEDCNALFPAYVIQQMAQLEPEERPAIDTVTVTLEAESAFRQALAQRLEQQK